MYRIALALVLAPLLIGGATPAPTVAPATFVLARDAETRWAPFRLTPGAAAGGWKTGEDICTVDSQAITPAFPRSSRARWSAGTPGQTVMLGLCGGGPSRPLMLADFY